MSTRPISTRRSPNRRVEQAFDVQALDVTVIGAGVAGSLAAFLSAKAGLRTLLVERKSFPRYKVCGACLNPRCLSLLEAAGLSHLLDDAVPLTRLDLRTNQHRAVVELPGSVALSRASLDVRLTEAAEAQGAHVLFESSARVEKDIATDGSRIVTVSKSQHPDLSIRTKTILAADGLSHPSLARLDEFQTTSVAASRFGAGTMIDAPDNEFEIDAISMATGSAGYVGMTFVEDGKLNIAGAFDRHAMTRARSLGDLADQVVHQAGFPRLPQLRLAKWTGTPSLTRRTTPTASQGIFLIGDAVGYVEPFTGEGMAWALASATAVQPFVEQASVAWSDQLAKDWDATWHKSVGQHQFWCRRIAWLLKRPRMAQLATRVLRQSPWLGRSLARRLQSVGVEKTLS